MNTALAYIAQTNKMASKKVPSMSTELYKLRTYSWEVCSIMCLVPDHTNWVFTNYSACISVRHVSPLYVFLLQQRTRPMQEKKPRFTWERVAVARPQRGPWEPYQLQTLHGLGPGVPWLLMQRLTEAKIPPRFCRGVRAVPATRAHRPPPRPDPRQTVRPPVEGTGCEENF